MPPLLVDTCLAIWLVGGAPIGNDASAALAGAAARGIPAYISPITAWEIGLLVSRRRIALTVTPGQWFDLVIALPGIRLAELTPAILLASSFLPGDPPNDPADRIIAATARDLGAILITRDRLLLGYGKQGHVGTLAC